jgi:hypothetical protein
LEWAIAFGAHVVAVIVFMPLDELLRISPCAR